MAAAIQSAAARLPGKTTISCSPELSFLLESAAEIGAAPPETLDWYRLWRLAERHGLAPLVHAQLQHGAARGVPSDVMAKLRKAFEQSARRALVLGGELQRLSALFKEARISVIPFKGPALGAVAYGDAALREFCDLDFFISPRDLAAARDLLLRHGFEPEYRIEGRTESLYLRNACELNFRSPGDAYHVELHWQPLPRVFVHEVNTEAIMERARTACLEQGRTTAFAPEDLVLLLSLHAAKHLWSRLLWICDLARVIQASPQIDPATLRQQAQESGAERTVAVSLRLAADLFGVSIPDWASQNRRAASLAPGIAGTLDEEFAPPESGMRAWRMQCRLRDSMVDRLRYTWRLAFTPDVEHLVSHPGTSPLRASVRRFARILHRSMAGEPQR